MRYVEAKVLKKKLKLIYSVDDLVSDERFKIGLLTFKWNDEFKLYVSFIKGKNETDYNENGGLLIKC